MARWPLLHNLRMRFNTWLPCLVAAILLYQALDTPACASASPLGHKQSEAPGQPHVKPGLHQAAGSAPVARDGSMVGLAQLLNSYAEYILEGRMPSAIPPGLKRFHSRALLAKEIGVFAGAADAALAQRMYQVNFPDRV